MLPLISIIGRPNVGKSTLFNRFIGKRKAIVTDIPGTTRDRIFESAVFGDIPALVVDTGGIESGDKKNIEADVQEQAKIAINESDIILFIINGREELTEDDYHTADILRRSGKKTFLLINKCDNEKISSVGGSFYSLGFGEPLCISALQGYGISVLRSILSKELSVITKNIQIEHKMTFTDDDCIKVAIIGRPNTGKSTLVNALLNEKKMITSEIPGTTRDSVSHVLSYNSHQFLLIDTAGIRRRGKIQKSIEKFSLLRFLQSIDEADIVFWLIDCKEGVAKQDMHVLQYALEKHKGVVLTVNKSDIMNREDQTKPRYLSYLQRKLPFAHFAPVVFISALLKKNIHALLDLAFEIHKQRHKKIQKDDFLLFLKRIVMEFRPETRGKIKLKLYGGEQTGVNPPRFVIYINRHSLLHFSYMRYLENKIREEYGFGGTGIKVEYRERQV